MASEIKKSTSASPVNEKSWPALEAGNKKYVSKADKQKLAELAKGQHPYAIVVGCSDSRVPVEKIFGIEMPGEVFVIRVAGNVAADASVLGSVEYAVAHLHVPLLVVLGHSECGAVKGAMQGVAFPSGKAPLSASWQKEGGEHDHIATLLSHIEPACKKAGGVVQKAVEANVEQQVLNLLKLSSVVRAAHDTGKLEVIGAVYYLKTGEVRRIR